MASVRRLLLIAALCCCARHAWADSVVVLLAQTGASSPDAAAVLYRVRGELGADRFTVVVIDPVAAEARAHRMEEAGRTRGASLTAGLFIDAASRTAELCLVDSSSGRILVRRLEASPRPSEETAESFARHVVELLRSSLLDFVSPKQEEPVGQRPAAESRAAFVPAITPEPPAPRSLAIDAGIAALGAPDFALMSYSPLLRVTVTVLDPIRLRLGGAWFGSEAVVRGQHGEGRVGQSVVLLDAVMRLASYRSARATLSLGAGIYRVSIAGTATPPYLDARDSSIALALCAGLGVELSLSERTDIGVDLQALARSPAAEVNLGDEGVAHLGRPALLMTASVREWW